MKRSELPTVVSDRFLKSHRDGTWKKFTIRYDNMFEYGRLYQLPLHEQLSIADGIPDLIGEILDSALKSCDGHWGKLAENFADDPVVTQAIKEEIKRRMEGRS